MNDTPTPRTDAEVNNRPRTIQQYMGDSLRDALVPSEFSRTLETELTAAREEITLLKNAIANDRDAASAEYLELAADYKCLAELLDGHDATECRMNLVRLKEQRDRLAAVLQDIRDGYGGQVADPNCDCGDCAFLIPIDEALQSLDQPKP